jgi:hypothetical protein
VRALFELVLFERLDGLRADVIEPVGAEAGKDVGAELPEVA